MRDKQIEEMVMLMTEGARPSAEDAEALYNAGYRKASDVARAIFEDIEAVLTMNHCQHRPFGSGEYVDYFANGLEEDIAEIKKKYESEGEG